MRSLGTSLRPLEIWRKDVSLDDARRFGSSLLATAVRAGAGSVVRRIGRRPDEALVLYEMETCPWSRLVREALSELDLDVLVKPCPEGEWVHRNELAQLRGEVEVPYLIDLDAGLELGDTDVIVHHLYERYGGLEPRSWIQGGALSFASSVIASTLRGGPLEYQRPARQPTQPLVLWNYEGSPHCRIVRERIDTLGLPYISRNLARRSPRRTEYVMSFGKLQFPRLDDPNTGVGLFESDAILAYLDTTYAAPVLRSVTSIYSARMN